MRTQVITQQADIDTLSDEVFSNSFGTPVAATRQLQHERTVVDGQTLVGSLVPGEPIKLAWDIGDFSLTAAELVAAAPIIDALEHEMASADAVVVAWLYARI